MKKTIISIVLSALLLTTFTRNEAQAQIVEPGAPLITIGIDPATTIALIGAYHLIDYVLATREWSKKIPPIKCDTLAPKSDCEEWSDWVERTAVVDGNVLGYEECKFIVSYASRFCYSNPDIMQINIFSWSAKWTLLDKWGGNDCPHFKHDVESKTPFEKAKAYLEIEKALYDRISRQLFLIANELSYKTSGHYIECGSGKKIKIMYSLATCNSVVSAIYKAKNGKEEVLQRKIPCVENSCCKFENTYCWDKEKKTVVSTTKYDGPTEENCNGNVDYGRVRREVIDVLKNNGYNLIDIVPTPCVPSCSEYVPNN